MKLLLSILFLIACATISCADHSMVEYTEPKTDTLVVIQRIIEVDTAGMNIGKAGAIITGGSISPEPLFKNGKTRDTIYESKTVFK